MKRLKVSILGASGYGGAELLRRLFQHPLVEVVGIGSRQYESQPLEACWPQFAGLSSLIFEDTATIIEKCDLLFSAAPHGSATSDVKAALQSGRKVVDLSADFRLRPDTYRYWYKEEMHYPELYPQAIYGLCELHRQEIYGANLISNPGCHTTTANLALAPLAAAGLLGDDIIVNSATGISGAGRSAKVNNLYSEVNENYVPYSLAGTHRHTGEIEETLGRVKAMGRQLKTHADFDPVMVSFNPYRAPMTRGILASCYTKSPDSNISEEKLLDLYQDFYSGEPLIHVSSSLPETKAVFGTDRCILSVRYDQRTGHIIALAATDNLGKGAAGQAVHNFNLMQGYEESLALIRQAVWP
ncbi:MAG: N-acetyl-gamma-glutamyl-phosphate reductase [Deinococcales bacterium]